MPLLWAKQSAHDKIAKSTLEQLVNCYAEPNWSGTKSKWKVLPVPGLRLWHTYGAGPIRGLCLASGKLLVVSGQALFVVNPDGTSTNLTTTSGVAIGGNGPVSMASDDSAAGGQGQALICTDIGSYVANIGLATLSAVDNNWYSSVTSQDGFAILVLNGTNQIWVTPVDNWSSINPLGFTSLDAYNGIALAAVSVNDTVTVFGTQSLASYINSGLTDFPFTRLPGSVLQVGCGAAYSPVAVQDSIMWLAATSSSSTSATGELSTGWSFQRVAGSQHSIISTPGIDSWLRLRQNPSSARGMYYRQDGHDHVCWSFTDGSVCYDATTGLWHDRQSYSLPRYAPDCYASFAGLDLVGDYQSASLYQLDPTYATDDSGLTLPGNSTSQIQRVLMPDPLHGNGNQMIMDELILEVQVGVGLDGNGAGSQPKWCLDWSDNAGQSWSNQLFRSAGKIGQDNPIYQARWNRLGQFYDRTLRLQYADFALMPAVLGAYGRFDMCDG